MRPILIGAVLAALLGGCTSPHPDAVTQAYGHEVALYVTPGASGETNHVRVEVRGSRVPEISELALSMADMPKPHVVKLTDAGTGSYDAENVRFSMAGTWHVSVLERVKSGTREFASFDVTIR